MPNDDHLYDPQTGSRLLTIKESAVYLGYHLFSVYRLVAQGVLTPYKKAGRTLLFLREEIDRFKVSNAWAAQKASIEKLPTAPEKPVSGLTAEVTVKATLMPAMAIYSRTIENFTWDQIPLIRADIDDELGNKPFNIEIKSPDGSRWSVSYDPPTWLEKGLKKIKKRLER